MDIYKAHTRSTSSNFRYSQSEPFVFISAVPSADRNHKGKVGMIASHHRAPLDIVLTSLVLGRFGVPG